VRSLKTADARGPGLQQECVQLWSGPGGCLQVIAADEGAHLETEQGGQTEQVLRLATRPSFQNDGDWPRLVLVIRIRLVP
jgi:hypothetical protein